MLLVEKEKEHKYSGSNVKGLTILQSSLYHPKEQTIRNKNIIHFSFFFFLIKSSFIDKAIFAVVYGKNIFQIEKSLQKTK